MGEWKGEWKGEGCVCRSSGHRPLRGPARLLERSERTLRDHGCHGFPSGVLVPQPWRTLQPLPLESNLGQRRRPKEPRTPHARPGQPSSPSSWSRSQERRQETTAAARLASDGPALRRTPGNTRWSKMLRRRLGLPPAQHHVRGHGGAAQRKQGQAILHRPLRPGIIASLRRKPEPARVLGERTAWHHPLPRSTRGSFPHKPELTRQPRRRWRRLFGTAFLAALRTTSLRRL